MPIQVVLYQPEIPPNTGNIARTCALTGTPLHLIRPLGFSIDDRALKRAGLDYWHLLNLSVHDSLEAFLEEHSGGSFYFFSSHAKKHYTDVEYPENSFLIFGKETAGLPEFIHRQYPDRLVKIPMSPKPGVRSLNLSNTVAIAVYEAYRQQDFPFMRQQE